jgi:hypothetical protein
MPLKKLRMLEERLARAEGALNHFKARKIEADGFESGTSKRRGRQLVLEERLQELAELIAKEESRVAELKKKIALLKAIK